MTSNDADDTRLGRRGPGGPAEDEPAAKRARLEGPKRWTGEGSQGAGWMRLVAVAERAARGQPCLCVGRSPGWCACACLRRAPGRPLWLAGMLLDRLSDAGLVRLSGGRFVPLPAAQQEAWAGERAWRVGASEAWVALGLGIECAALRETLHDSVWPSWAYSGSQGRVRFERLCRRLRHEELEPEPPDAARALCTAWGKLHENRALAAFLATEEAAGLVLHESPFVLQPGAPHQGATADGVLYRPGDTQPEAVLEVKTPVLLRFQPSPEPRPVLWADTALARAPTAPCPAGAVPDDALLEWVLGDAARFAAYAERAAAAGAHIDPRLLERADHPGVLASLALCPAEALPLVAAPKSASRDYVALPADYMLQIQLQLRATGAAWGYFLNHGVDGCSRLFRVPHDAALTDAAVTLVEALAVRLDPTADQAPPGPEPRLGGAGCRPGSENENENENADGDGDEDAAWHPWAHEPLFTRVLLPRLEAACEASAQQQRRVASFPPRAGSGGGALGPGVQARQAAHQGPLDAHGRH